MSATEEETWAIRYWVRGHMRERNGLGTDEQDGCTFAGEDILAMVAEKAPGAESALRHAFLTIPLPLDLKHALSTLNDRAIGILMQAGAARFLPATEAQS